MIRSLKQEGERARTALRVLETMTYSCANPDDLHEITSEIEEIIVTLKGKLSRSEGLILRPEARKKARERAQKVCRKYRPVPKSVLRGRPKTDWRYHNRVGKKATELHKETQRSKTTSYNTLDNCTGMQLLIVLHTKFTTAFYTGITPSDWKDSASPNSNGHEKKRISTGKVVIYTLNILTTYTILYTLP